MKLTRSSSAHFKTQFNIEDQRHINRRQSCHCSECGSMSIFQKTNLHINLIVSEHAHRQEKIDSTHSGDESNSHTNISVELITKNKSQNIRQKKKLISLPPVHYELLFEIKNRKRRNSCCCQECGQQNQFQQKTQNLFVKHQIVHQRKFVIRKVRAIKTQTQIEVTQKPLKTLHMNSPMMKYSTYSRTAQLILDQNKVRFKHNRICSEALIGIGRSHFKTVSLHNLTIARNQKALQSRPSIF